MRTGDAIRILSVKRLREHLPIIIRLRQTGSSAPTVRRSHLRAGADHKAKAGTFAFTGICRVRAGTCPSGCEIRYSRLYPENGFLPDVQQLCEQITRIRTLSFSAIPIIRRACRSREQILQIAKRCEETATRLILDECFCDLLDHPEAYSVARKQSIFRAVYSESVYQNLCNGGLRLATGSVRTAGFCAVFLQDASLEHFRAGPGGRMRGTAGKRLFKRSKGAFKSRKGISYPELRRMDFWFTIPISILFCFFTGKNQGSPLV